MDNGDGVDHFYSTDSDSALDSWNSMRLSLTKSAEYAIRAMVWLAQEEAGASRPARHKAAAIASAAGIPPVFAARVLAQLQRRGLVRSRAGPQGGYTLARPAANILLLEVIESFEGPLTTTTCVLRETSCGFSNRYCVLHSAWSAAQAALRDILAGTSLADALPAGERGQAARDGGLLTALDSLPVAPANEAIAPTSRSSRVAELPERLLL